MAYQLADSSSLRVIKLKELAGRVKLLNDFQRLLQSPNRALFAEDGDDIMNAGTNGGTGQCDAHGLGEFAHLQAVFVERFGKGLLDRGFAEIAQAPISFSNQSSRIGAATSLVKNFFAAFSSIEISSDK